MAEKKLKLVSQASGGRPAKISRERILEVARQLDAGELTFSRIAEKLGVRQPALYYHFESREELLHELALELAKEFNLKPGNPKKWRQWLEETALHFYDVMVANPAVLEVSNWKGLAMFGMPIMETALETLEDAGYGIEEAGRAWQVVGDMVYAGARVLNDAKKAGISPGSFDAEALVGRPLPRTRAYNAKTETDPRKHLAATLHWVVATLPTPRK